MVTFTTVLNRINDPRVSLVIRGIHFLLPKFDFMAEDCDNLISFIALSCTSPFFTDLNNHQNGLIQGHEAVIFKTSINQQHSSN